MDLIQLFFSALSIFIFTFFLTKSLRLWTQKKEKRTPPMVPGAWPLIGHLSFYSLKPFHCTFGDMADKYGTVFMVKHGSHDSVIISDPEVAKECFTVHDKYLMERSILTASKLLGYNDLFLTFVPYGDYWKEMRKITASKIFSPSVIETFKNRRAREADVAVRDLYKTWEQKGKPKNGVLLDMKKEFNDIVRNTSIMTIVGKRYYGVSPNCEMGEARRCVKLIKDFFDHFDTLLITDIIPSLSWLDWRSKISMKRTAIEVDKLVESWVKEHKNKNCCDESEKDIMDRYIESFENEKVLSTEDVHITIKALCLNLVMSGSETATAILIWVISLLVTNTDVLRKAQEELDRIVGKERVVDESDIKDLVYLQAIVKETFRLYPPIPLVAQRSVTEGFDIVNGTYHIPPGARVIINTWKIGQDPSLFSDPEKFEPERFLTSNKDIEFSPQSYKLIGFGLGRRSCPAIPLGLRMLHYILARFLHSFDVARPSNQEIDMTQTNGLVNIKATPLEVFITPRLPQSLYHVD